MQAGTQPGPGLRRGRQPGLGDNALLHQAIGKLDRAEGKCDHRQSDNNVKENNFNFYWNEWRMEFLLRELWNPYIHRYRKDGHYIYIIYTPNSALSEVYWLRVVFDSGEAMPCSGEIFPTWNVMMIITGATWLTRPGRHWPVMWTLTHSYATLSQPIINTHLWIKSCCKLLFNDLT